VIAGVEEISETERDQRPAVESPVQECGIVANRTVLDTQLPPSATGAHNITVDRVADLVEMAVVL
jgi:hypothetical protein